MVDFYGRAAPSGLEIDSVATARRLHDGHWFDDETMRFFRTRIGAERRTHAGLLFVTSEKGPDDVRRYSVRLAYWRRRPDGRWVVSISPLCGMRRAWADTPVHGRAHAAKRLAWMAQVRAELATHKSNGNRALEFGCRQAWDACWEAARGQADETWRLP